MSAPEGILSRLGILLGAKLAYVRARLELASLEGKEAALHFAMLAVLAIAVLVAFVFGYFLLVIGLVFLIARVLGGDHAWMLVLLGAAGLHFLAALIFALVMRARLARPIFSATLDELKKDQQWLKSPENPS